MSYHISNLGMFGKNIPTDINGYIHLTKEDWMNAPMDGKVNEDMAEQLAEQSRNATQQSEKEISNWQHKNI
jgi:predicted DNA-binding protein (MmcQ/YjbR family)